MRKKIKVGIDVTPLAGNPTGIGGFVEAIGSGLAESTEIDVTGVVVSYKGRGEIDQKIPDGMALKHIKFPARLAHLTWHKADWPALHGFDIVHGTNYVVPPAGGARELVTIHDLSAWKYPELLDTSTRNFPTLVTRSLERGAHIHTVSDFVAEEIKEHLKISAEKIHVIKNGFKKQNLGKSENGKKIAGGEYIFAIGTIEPRKDYPTLIKAMSKISEIFPNLKLVIAGSDGWGIEAFDAATAKYDPDNKIIRLGYVDEQTRADLLAGAEVLVYPSLYEGFGLPLLEAMSAGIPVVSTDVGSIPEVAGDAAVLVPAKSSNALAGAILDVLESDEVRKHLIASGTKRLEKFSWDDSVTKMIELYKTMVQ